MIWKQLKRIGKDKKRGKLNNDFLQNSRKEFKRYLKFEKEVLLFFFVTMIRNAVAIMSVDFQVNQRPHECLFHGRRKLHFGRLPHVISFWSQFLSSQLLSESCCPLLLIFSHAWLANYWKTPTLNYCQQKRPQFEPDRDRDATLKINRFKTRPKSDSNPTSIFQSSPHLS